MSKKNIVRPILVGVDGSDLSYAALDWALDEAERRNLPVHVLVARGLPLAVAATLIEPNPISGRRAEAILSEAVARAEERCPTVRVATSSAPGSPAASLVDASRKAAMVVVGKGLQRSPVGEAILGSTAAQVGAHAKCPVVILDSENAQAPGDAVVVGIDGSKANKAAIAFAFEEAAARGSELVAVHAWWVSVPDRTSVEELAQDVQGTITRSQEALMAKAIAGPSRKHPDVVVRPIGSQERPADALVEAAKSAGLIVVGSRGHGGFVGLVLGSVSQGLLHRALPCPLVVVHTRD